MFKNMTIKSRLIVVIGFLSALLVSIGGMGIYGMNQMNSAFKGVMTIVFCHWVIWG